MIAAWRHVARLVVRRPGLLLAFLVQAALEMYALAVFWATPAAWSTWMDGFIARNYGEMYIPFAFRAVILPALLGSARLALELVVGPVAVAWVTARVVFLLRGESLGLWGALAAGIRRYPAFLALGLMSIGLSRLTTRGVSALFSLQRGGSPVFPAPEGLYALVVTLFLAISVIEALLVYAPAAMIAAGQPLWRALPLSMREMARRPGTTLALVAVPALPFFLLSASASLAPALGLKTSIPALLAASIAVGALSRLWVTAGAACAVVGRA